MNEVLYKSVASRLHRARRRPGAHRAIHGLDQLDKIIAVDQSPIGRTPRSNPATYTGLFDVIRDMFSKTQEARARGYKPGRFSLQREGRALRGLQGRRADQDRDALPARRVRPLRAVPRQALQPRDAGGEVQGQEHRRRARHGDRGRAGLLRAHPQGAPPAGDAERGRARLRAARPARDDAVGRRGAAREARDRALEGRDRQHPVHPRRADDGVALRRRGAAAGGAATAGRRGQQRGRDRAQPRRDQVAPTG